MGAASISVSPQRRVNWDDTILVLYDVASWQVSNIAQSILSELDRVRGTKLTLTLDIDAETAEGFPEDVESVVRDNAASLRITDFGFEGD